MILLLLITAIASYIIVNIFITEIRKITYLHEVSTCIKILEKIYGTEHFVHFQFFGDCSGEFCFGINSDVLKLKEKELSWDNIEDFNQIIEYILNYES